MVDAEELEGAGERGHVVVEDLEKYFEKIAILFLQPILLHFHKKMVFSFLVQHIDPDLDEVVLPDGGVGEGEDPAGQVPGQGGEAHVGDLES